MYKRPWTRSYASLSLSQNDLVWPISLFRTHSLTHSPHQTHHRYSSSLTPTATLPFSSSFFSFPSATFLLRDSLIYALELSYVRNEPPQFGFFFFYLSFTLIQPDVGRREELFSFFSPLSLLSLFLKQLFSFFLTISFPHNIFSSLNILYSCLALAERNEQ